MRLIDTHYHYDFLPLSARPTFRAELAREGVDIIAQTVVPSGFHKLEHEGLAMPAVGFHPWYIEDNFEEELEIFRTALTRTRFVGEIGLDFAPRRLDDVSAATQLQVFKSILEAVREAAAASTEPAKAPYILSIHTVRSASEVLNLLEDVDRTQAVPIFHRFGGTSDELTRLIRSGGYISVNPLMLRSKRGRAYVTQVPVDKLLLETDLPQQKDSGEPDPAAQVIAALKQTLAEVAKLRKMTATELADALDDNARKLGF